MSNDAMKEKFIVYQALGFPIIIFNPKFIVFEGERVPDINPEKIMKAAFKAIIYKPARISGAEVKFIRGYMELSQDDFSRLLGVERSIISKWQEKKLLFTGMDAATELLLRTQCLFFLNKNASIKKGFINKMLSQALSTKDVGDPIELSA